MEVKVDNSSTTDTIPQIIPCCYGKEVGVEPEIIRTGLAAISIKRNPKKDKSGNQDRRFENRNSFFNLHRPEMTKINWVSTSQRKIEQFFHDHATNHGPFCAYLHAEKEPVDEDFQCLLQPSEYKYNEEEFGGVSNSIGNSVLLRSCSMQLSDEDLHPSNICHRSRAEFCVTIGTNTESPFRPVCADPSATSPAEHKDSLPPLTKKPRIQKAGTRATPRTSPLGSPQHLSTIGQSVEIAAITPLTTSQSDEVLNTLPEVDDDDDHDDDDDGEDNTSFRLILPPQDNVQRDSLPNEMTEADELKIRSLQKQNVLPGGGNYDKKQPPVAKDSAPKRTRT